MYATEERTVWSVCVKKTVAKLTWRLSDDRRILAERKMKKKEK